MTHTAQNLTVDTEVFRHALCSVMDPEIGINIVDLGLVYGLEFQDETLVAEITMTSPACPMGQLIVDEAEEALLECLAAHPPASDRLPINIEVKLVWESVWTPAMMSENARKILGW